ncbi:MAG: sigma-54-dependent Fis family transcriptional regulator [Planctomycetes bacterium]|nr:sigma-54-dependent Fis family transcriptional regulator [Planctomycetota bacterium]
MTKILVADPDPRSRQDLCTLLGKRGFQFGAAAELGEALPSLADGDFDLVLCDLSLPGGGGMKLLQEVKHAHPETAVVLLSAFGSVQDAVTAMRQGAADFLGKPFAADQVLVAVDRALEKSALQKENLQLKSALDDRLRLDNVVGTDPRMQAIFKTVKAVADTRTTVLITGESGTGKTLLARALHSLSGRRNGPFVEVNCGALPESLLESELFGHVKGAFTGAVRDKVGKFEAASGGTIFLDEIGTSSPGFQVKLLRVLQDRVIERVGDTRTLPVDVRVVLATNKDLEKAVAAGEFREDLYYRIQVVSIEMPPLRARASDVPTLAEHFLRRFAADHGRPALHFTPAALQQLAQAPWPGNVRQLENVVERAVVLSQGELLDVADLPLLAQKPGQPAAVGLPGPHTTAPDGVPRPLREALMESEAAIIAQALQHCGGNRERAAKVLGINRSTLFAKLKKLGIA